MEVDINKQEEQELAELNTPRGCYAIFMSAVIMLLIMMTLVIVALVKTYIV